MDLGLISLLALLQLYLYPGLLTNFHCTKREILFKYQVIL